MLNLPDQFYYIGWLGLGGLGVILSYTFGKRFPRPEKVLTKLITLFSVTGLSAYLLGLLIVKHFRDPLLGAIGAAIWFLIELLVIIITTVITDRVRKPNSQA